MVFVVSFEHFMTFRRTVSSRNEHLNIVPLQFTHGTHSCRTYYDSGTASRFAVVSCNRDFQFRSINIPIQGVSENTDTFFSVFEGLDVRQGTCSVHETKEGFMEICLTACMLSSIRWYNRTKEKVKTLQFHF